MAVKTNALSINHTLERHQNQMRALHDTVKHRCSGECRYLLAVIDGPESLNRQASYSSSFDMVNTHEIFKALAEQTKA